MRILILTHIIILSGCVAAPYQPKTLEEWQSVTTRTYVMTEKDILAASEKIVRLADTDEKDVDIVYTNNELYVTRKFFVYFVIGAHFGQYTFHIKTNKTEDGIETSLFIANSSTGVTPNPVYTPGAGAGIGGGNTSTGGVPWQYPGLYDLFYARLDYLLGASKQWITCDEAKEVYKGRGPIEGLCAVAEDVHPTAQ